MHTVPFTDEELHTIAHLRFHHPHPRVQRKMEVMWLKAHQIELGLTHQAMATLAGVSRSTVQRYLDDYLNGGLDAVRRVGWNGAAETDLTNHTVTLEEYFWDHPPRSARQAQAVIEQQTGIRRGLTQVRAFLRSHLGLRYLKVGAVPCPPKKDPEEHAQAQAEFLDTNLQPRLEQARQGQRTIFFVDAAHFVFAPFLGFLWCLVRQFLRGPSGRKRYNVLGALNAVTHELVRVTNQSYINAESVCTLLSQLAASNAGVPSTVVLDNVRYQRCQWVQETATSLGIELLFLPSYSPNLNLIERVWRFLRKEALDTIDYETFDRFMAGIDQCLDQLSTTYKAEMDTLLTHKFQRFENVSFLAA